MGQTTQKNVEPSAGRVFQFVSIKNALIFCILLKPVFQQLIVLKDNMPPADGKVTEGSHDVWGCRLVEKVEHRFHVLPYVVDKLTQTTCPFPAALLTVEQFLETVLKSALRYVVHLMIEIHELLSVCPETERLKKRIIACHLAK